MRRCSDQVLRDRAGTLTVYTRPLEDPASLRQESVELEPAAGQYERLNAPLDLCLVGGI